MAPRCCSRATSIPGARTDADNKAAAAERQARKYNARVYDSFPVRDFDRWLDDRHATLLVQPLRRHGGDGPARGVDAGDAGRILGQTGSGAENIAAAWTPDGSGGGVCADHQSRRGGAGRDGVVAVAGPGAGGEPRRLTTGAESYATRPSRPMAGRSTR